MLQTAASQHLLTGGTGWSWTYRYAKTLKNCAALRKNKTCVLVMVTQAVFVIGLETHGVQIYDVARGCLKKFFLKIVHFHNLGVSLGMCSVYICTGADRKAEKL